MGEESMLANECEVRRQTLLRRMGFWCQCTRCVTNMPRQSVKDSMPIAASAAAVCAPGSDRPGAATEVVGSTSGLLRLSWADFECARVLQALRLPSGAVSAGN